MGSSTSSSSSAGQANSVNRSRISLGHGRIRDLTMVFTKRFTNCFGRKETVTNISRSSAQHAEVHSDLRIARCSASNTTRGDVQTKTLRQVGRCVWGCTKSCMHRSNPCTPEGVQCCTQKFRNHRVRGTFHKNMRISERQLCLNPTSCTKRQCVSLDRFVVHSRLTQENQTLGGKNTAWLGRTSSIFFKADLRPESLLKSRSRGVPPVSD